MPELLRTLLSLSLSGTLLSFILFAGNRLLRGKLTRAFSYYVWLLVLLRLTVPLASSVNAMGALFHTDAGSVQAAQAEPSAPMPGDGADPWADAPIIVPPVSQGVLPNGADLPPAQPNAEDAAAPVHRAIPWASLWMALKRALPYIWAIGAFIAFSRVAISYMLFARKTLAASTPPRPEDAALFHALHKGGRVQLVCSAHAATPMLLGVLRPRIVIPALAYRQNGMEADLRNILCHELTHYRRGDLIYKWLVVLVTSIHWFNPFMLLIKREIAHACELACDEAVTAPMTMDERRQYGSTLLVLSSSKGFPAGTPAATLYGEKENLKERLTNIMQYKRKTLWTALLCAALAVVLAGSAVALGAAVPEVPDTEPIQPAYTCPDHYEGTYTQGRLTVNYDADVIVSPAAAYPVYRVKDVAFTQEFAERIVNALVGDSQLIELYRPQTKAELADEMEQAAEHWWSSFFANEDELRAYYGKKILAAPETVEDMPIDRNALINGFDAKADTDGNGLYDCALSMYMGIGGLNISYYRLNEATGQRVSYTHYKDVTISREKAQAFAEEMVKKLGFDDFALQCYGYGTSSSMPGHRFVFGRMVGTTPNVSVRTAMGGWNEKLFEAPDAPQWDIEQIEVLVDDNGVMSLSICGLTEQAGVIDENATLLPFDKIMKKAGQQLYELNPSKEWIETWKNQYETFTVTSIQLKYIRIWDKDSAGQEFRLVPAWFFYLKMQGSAIGPDGNTYRDCPDTGWADENHLPLLMVNAIDGNVIHWYTGY